VLTLWLVAVADGLPHRILHPTLWTIDGMSSLALTILHPPLCTKIACSHFICIESPDADGVRMYYCGNHDSLSWPVTAAGFMVQIQLYMQASYDLGWGRLAARELLDPESTQLALLPIS
jgi:hypothetical protein